MAKGRKTGGRVAGSKNKITAAREAELATSGLMPLTFMSSILRDEAESADRRQWAAENAAPFCHPRLTAVDVKANISMSHEDWLEQLK